MDDVWNDDYVDDLELEDYTDEDGEIQELDFDH